MFDRRWYEVRGDQTNKPKRPYSGSVERILFDPTYAGMDTLNEEKLMNRRDPQAKKAYERRRRDRKWSHGR